MPASPPFAADPARPDVTAATIVLRHGRMLLVEEIVHGRAVLNQPSGHLEPGESLLEAAVRETLEETGWQVRPHCLVGSYDWQDPQDGRRYLRWVFAAHPVAHDPARPLDTGICRTLWLLPSELAASDLATRSPLVQLAVDDYLSGRRLPLSAVQRR